MCVCVCVCVFTRMPMYVCACVCTCVCVHLVCVFLYCSFCMYTCAQAAAVVIQSVLIFVFSGQHALMPTSPPASKPTSTASLKALKRTSRLVWDFSQVVVCWLLNAPATC